MDKKNYQFTKGGQLILLKWRMLVQLTNIIFKYLIGLFFVAFACFMSLFSSWAILKNGYYYWLCRTASSIDASMNKIPDPHATYPILYHGKSYSLTIYQILTNDYTIAQGLILKDHIITSAICALGICVIASLIATYYLQKKGRESEKEIIIGGRTLSDAKTVSKMIIKNGEASDLMIDDLVLLKNSEVQNFGMIGTVGVGKSTVLRKLIKQCKERDDLIIIYDKAGTFIRDFYNEENGDVILNPADKRCANWDMWEDCERLADFNNVANTLIEMGNNQDPFWQQSARTIFSESAFKMRDFTDRTYSRFLTILLSMDLEGLRGFLDGTPASALVDGKIEKTAISIRSVLTNYVKSIRYLQAAENTGKPKFSIKSWMQGNDSQNKGILFISSDQRYHESLKPIISMWLAIASNSLLSMGENRNRRVWFLMDELPSLHQLPELPSIMAESRKFGGCFALGFQSYAQLEDIYGQKTAAGLYDLLNTKFFFRNPSEVAAKFAQREIGEVHKKRPQEQASIGSLEVRDGMTISEHEERVPLVSYSDIQKLPDLSCFVTLPNDYPVVNMTLNKEILPKQAEEFIESEIIETLKQSEKASYKSSTESDTVSSATDKLFNHSLKRNEQFKIDPFTGEIIKQEEEKKTNKEVEFNQEININLFEKDDR